MKAFARVTKLSNIQGRADYITDENKQEYILAKSSSVNWKPYQEYERLNQQTNVKNNEGREVIIALPNEWANDNDLFSKAQKLAVTAIEKNTDMQWAVHWNKNHTNLHMHVIFSERQRDEATKRYDRDVYATDDGKVARRKADRARDENGNIKPPIHFKGEIKGFFTAKDTRYTSKAWTREMKINVRQVMERYGAIVEQNDPLNQYHHGKGKDAPKIIEKNDVIKQANEQIKAYAADGRNPEKIIKAMKAALKNRNYPELAKQTESIKSVLEQQRRADAERRRGLESEKIGTEMGRLKTQYLREYQNIGDIRKKHSDLAREMTRTTHRIDGIEKDISEIKAKESQITKLQEQKKSFGAFKGKQKKQIEQKIEGIKQSLAYHIAFFEREYQTTREQYTAKLEEHQQHLSEVNASVLELPSAKDVSDREQVLRHVEMQYKALKVYSDICQEHEQRMIKSSEDRVLEQFNSEQGKINTMSRYQGESKLNYISPSDYQQIKERMPPATMKIFDQLNGTKDAPSYAHPHETHNHSFEKRR